jgi:hypothetical protein
LDFLQAMIVDKEATAEALRLWCLVHHRGSVTVNYRADGSLDTSAVEDFIAERVVGGYMVAWQLVGVMAAMLDCPTADLLLELDPLLMQMHES